MTRHITSPRIKLFHFVYLYVILVIEVVRSFKAPVQTLVQFGVEHNHDVVRQKHTKQRLCTVMTDI